METGVDGEHGVHVLRRVVVACGHDLDNVTIQLLHMAVPIVNETTMTRHNVLNQHAQIFMLLLSVYCFHSSALISFPPFMNSNPNHCEVYSIQHYVINFISELW